MNRWAHLYPAEPAHAPPITRGRPAAPVWPSRIAAATSAIASLGVREEPIRVKIIEIPPMPAPTRRASPQFIEAGGHYLLGHGRDFFGIWHRESPRDYPAQVFPRTDVGWERAWLRFCELEPRHSPALGRFRSMLKKNGNGQGPSDHGPSDDGNRGF
jgi:hypothetical protein